MIDNRTTELREKLDKLITKIERLDIKLDSPAYGMTLGEYEQEREKLLDEFEQAIAATLGSEREKALEELVQDWQALYEYPDYGDCCHLKKRIQELGIEVIDE